MPNEDATSHRARSQHELEHSLEPLPINHDSTFPNNLSTFSPVLEGSTTVVGNRSIDRSREPHTDPLGLNVVHAPLSTPIVDIIFVHGLGGTSQKTWSRNRDPELFWPREWLPFEPELGTARVLSFGYNANFASAGRDIFNIADFAKDLLFGMKFGVDENANELEVGKVCL